MAFTITRQPVKMTPGYNELTFVVSSSNYLQPQMKYIFLVYVNGVLASTTKLFPRPDGTCRLDVEPIAKNYLSGARIDNADDVQTGKPGYVAQIIVKFFEEYIINNVLTTSSLLDTSDTITIFEMVADRYEINLDTFMDNHIPTVANEDPLDDRLPIWSGPRIRCNESWSTDYSKSILPNECYNISEEDNRNITIVSKNATASTYAYKLLIRTYTIDNNCKKFYLNLPDVTASTPIENYILHIPIGIDMLNNFTWTSTFIPVGDLTDRISYDEDQYYSVEILDNSTPSKWIYKPIMFKIVPPFCYEYKHCVIQYKTPFGGWWYINADMKKSYSEENSRVTMLTKPTYLDTSTTMNEKVIAMNGVGKWVLNTDWLPTQNHIMEITDMLKSPEVYIIVPDLVSTSNVTIPVIVNTSSYVVNTIDQDKLVQYTLEFSEAFNKRYTI